MYRIIFPGISPPEYGVVTSSTVYVYFYSCTAAILPTGSYYDVNISFNLIEFLKNILYWRIVLCARIVLQIQMQDFIYRVHYMYLNYPLRKRMRHIIFSSMGCVPVSYFPHYVLQSKAFEKKYQTICFVFIFLLVCLQYNVL